MNSKLLFLVVAVPVLAHLVGCAAPTEGDDQVNVDVAATTNVDETSTSPSVAGVLAGQSNLTLAGDITVCTDSPTSATGSLFKVTAATGANCVPREYDRGVGIPMQCASGLIQSGAICYRPCKTGYSMVAGVCWQTECPDNMKDIGAVCAKPAAYGRGAGYAIWDEDKCEDRHGNGNCEKYGLMWYPKCDEGFHNVGSNICSPDCPSDMTDTGAFCQKKTYVQNSSNTTPISYSWFPSINTPVFTAPLNSCLTDKSDRYHELCYTPCLKGWKAQDNRCVYAD